jgi:hypothetical protein
MVQSYPHGTACHRAGIVKVGSGLKTGNKKWLHIRTVFVIKINIGNQFPDKKYIEFEVDK